MTNTVMYLQCIVFTHEPRLIYGTQKTNIENVIKWGIDNGYVFDYHMYNIPEF